MNSFIILTLSFVIGLVLGTLFPSISNVLENFDFLLIATFGIIVVFVIVLLLQNFIVYKAYNSADLDYQKFKKVEKPVEVSNFLRIKRGELAVLKSKHSKIFNENIQKLALYLIFVFSLLIALKLDIAIVTMFWVDSSLKISFTSYVGNAIVTILLLMVIDTFFKMRQIGNFIQYLKTRITKFADTQETREKLEEFYGTKQLESTQRIL